MRVFDGAAGELDCAEIRGAHGVDDEVVAGFGANRAAGAVVEAGGEAACAVRCKPALLAVRPVTLASGPSSWSVPPLLITEVVAPSVAKLSSWMVVTRFERNGVRGGDVAEGAEVMLVFRSMSGGR